MMTRRFGSRAAARDSAGRPALDVDACVRAGLERVVGRDVDVASIRHCTGCHGDGYFSHRVRRESGRQVTAVWIEETP
jgi:copper oxidase (laccase) domain-containing protein